MRRRVSLIAKYFVLISVIPGLRGQTGTWLIDTIAGTDRPVNDGAIGFKALIDTPGGVVVDSAGNTIFADSGNHRVRKIGPDGIITTIVGTGIPGYAGDGGPAVSAQIITPQDVALDSSGNLYVSDYSANVVRKIAADGTISTYAGIGIPGNQGNGGKAIAATLNGPYALAVDGAGTLYIGEDLNNQIRKVTADGNISTLGRFTNPEGLAVDASGNVYVSAWGDNKIFKVTPAGVATLIAGTGGYGFSGDGGPATAATLASPSGLAFDSAGNLWFSDSGNNRIRNISSSGTIQTVIGSGSAGVTPLSLDPKSNSIYIPTGLTIDSKGLVTWTEAGNNRVRNYLQSSRVVTEIGGFTPALSSTGSPNSLLLFKPFAAATDASGNLFIADTANNVIRKITAAGVSTVVAGTGSPNFNGEVGTATQINLAQPQGVSVDGQGNIYIADTGSGRVRKVDMTGRISTIMGAGNGLPFSGTFAGNAFLFAPNAVVANPNGGFIVVDEIFGIVASVDAVGTITLIPTSTVNFLLLPAGVAVSGSTVYIADTYDNRILKYTGGSNISVFAGTGLPGYSGDNGPANKATMLLPSGLAVDSKGNVLIADTLNSAIRMVDSTGKITTLAGTGKPGFSGDKGPALNAKLAFPTSVAVDNSGNIEIADKGNNRIRQLKFVQVAPDLTLNSDTPSKSANHGSVFTVPLTLTSVGGFAGTASLSGGGPGGVNFQFSQASPVNITAGQTLAVTATVTLPASMAVGSYSLVFTATGNAGQRSTSVALTVTDLPQFPTAGVVSAASGVGDGIAPGEVIAIYGLDLGPANIALGAFDGNNVLSTQVGGTQVLFDGKPAPLIYSVNGQVSAIVPYAVAGKTSTQVQVQYNGKVSPSASVTVVDAAPGIFNIPGSSQAAALNFDLSTNSANNPAAPGSIVVLFATGEGQTDPGGVDGRIATDTFPKPLLPVSVTIGGQAAEVLYYGAAPFEVAGVMQVNVRVPAGTVSGAAAVVLKVGTRVDSGTSTVSVH